jgi:hypothetical protein
MIQHTASDEAPWYVVPADHKWFTRLVVAGAIIEALEGLDLSYPTVDEHKREELRLVQAELEREGGGSRKPHSPEKKARAKKATGKKQTMSHEKAPAATADRAEDVDESK